MTPHLDRRSALGPGAVAAVLDKIDRGLLTLGQRVDVTADILSAEGDGIFRLDGAYPSSVTLGPVLAALLTVSDDTAVRLCGLVCPAKEVNDILVAEGFPGPRCDRAFLDAVDRLRGVGPRAMRAPRYRPLDGG